jgi:integrase
VPVAELTDAHVKSLRCAPDQKLIELRDAALPGLELRVTANGVKSWRLHYTRRSDGKRRAVGLGKYPTVTLKAARLKVKQLQSQIEDETKWADPAAKRQARKEAPTFKELADEWIERHGKVNKSARALRDDRSMLDRHINPEIGSMKVMELRKRDIVRLLDIVQAKGDARTKKGKPARMLTHRPNRIFEVVRAIFRWALSRDVVQVDPTAGLSPPIKREKARERELTPAEIRTLWTALEATPIDRRKLPKGAQTGECVVGSGDLCMTRATALAIQISLATAQRIGEVAGMVKSEFDLTVDAPIWIIPRTRTKNGEPNRVPLSPLAVMLIRAAMILSEENKTWLFPSAISPEKPINPHAPTKAIERSRGALGIENVRIHDLRRTAATGMAKLGVSPFVVSLVLNHISVRRGTVTGRVYDQYTYDGEKRDALMKWGRQLEQIVS